MTKRRNKGKNISPIMQAEGASRAPAKLEVKRDGKGRIWSHVRQKWLVETPEEQVRQGFLCVLVSEYGFALGQIAEEENVVGRGAGQARADFVLWRTAQDKQDQKPPLIIVECKSDNVTIKPLDYNQGDNYARLTNAPFFVTHNTRETRFWRVRKDRMPGYLEEIENIPHADDSDDDIKKRYYAFNKAACAHLMAASLLLSLPLCRLHLARINLHEG
jgi:type I restriction enzyme M protein